MTTPDQTPDSRWTGVPPHEDNLAPGEDYAPDDGREPYRVSSNVVLTGEAVEDPAARRRIMEHGIAEFVHMLQETDPNLIEAIILSVAVRSMRGGEEGYSIAAGFVGDESLRQHLILDLAEKTVDMSTHALPTVLPPELSV